MIIIFLVTLLIVTYNRKHLTYRGVQILLILNNLILLIYCCYNWDFYIINYASESFSFKFNTNTWDNLPYEISFKINSLSFLFLLLVNIIGFATNIYILNYFKYEERAEEFILLINWFIFSMIFLVISNSLFALIIGWELIGLTSFLLINFWKFKTTTLSCSFKAFCFNKVSDLFLLLGSAILWNHYKINNIDTLLTYISMNKVDNSVLVYSCICFLISACIKSAQIIGHLWLPDSMEAPVPASALIHSATLVSAGIYLILKFQTLFIISQMMEVIFFIGSLTACFGGLIAAAQTDMKKLLAYSTISHCGFIMASISLDNFLITIVYLYLHGLFKASTFFCAGSIIKTNNTQDTRLMGNNHNQVFDVTSLIISTINLGGLPFTFGYLYKQMFISQLSISHYSYISVGLCMIGLLSSIVYVYKLIYYSCFDFRKGFLQTVYLYIQNLYINRSNLYLNFTWSKFFSFLIVYIYAIFFYIIVKFFFLENYVYFYYTPEVATSEFKYFENYFYLRKYIISIYYVLFITITNILILSIWRTNFFYHDTMEIIINLWGFFSFYFLLNALFKYLNNYVILLVYPYIILIMINFMYILVILYNLNLFLSFYIEIVLQLVTQFNYKHSFIFLNKYNFFDIVLYCFYKNKTLLKTILLVR